MQDIYHIGTSTRLSPEAPVPVVKIQETVTCWGGAANVAANLEALGAQVVQRYAEGLPRKHRLMVGDYHLARWDEDDECKALWPDDNPRLPSNATLSTVDAVIISDYNKDAFIVTTGIEMALRNFHKPIYIDTKQSPTKFGSLYDRALFFPNNSEWLQNKDTYSNAAKVVTLGPQGCWWSDPKTGENRHEPSHAKKIVSVSGAGDTVLAAFVYAQLSGLRGQDILRFAMDAAAVICAKPFTATASLAEIERVRNDH